MGKLKNADGGSKHIPTSSKKLKKNGASTEQLVEELLSKMTNTQQKSGVISSPSNKPNKSLNVTPSKKKLKKHEEEVNSVQVEQEPTVNKKLKKKKNKSEDSTTVKITLNNSAIESQEDEEEESPQQTPNKKSKKDKTKSPIKAAPVWNRQDEEELLNQIEKFLPDNDAKTYTSRVNVLKWEEVAFKHYSAEDCKVRWVFIQEHLRHYRVLGELINDAREWLEHPWHNFNSGSKTKPRHPDLPKEPCAPHLHYLKAKKASILKKHPGIGKLQLPNKAAELFKNLSEARKLKYTAIAEQEKKEYLIKLEKFAKDHPNDLPDRYKKKLGRMTQKPKAPKPFELYSQAKLPQLMEQGLTGLQARQMCHQNYKSLDAKKKLKWINRALKKESAYLEEMEKFKKEHPGVKVQKWKLLSEEEQKLKDQADGKPVKPKGVTNLNGYSIFCEEMRKNGHIGKSKAELMQMWKELGQEEKSIYQNKAKEAETDYKEQLAIYINNLPPEQRKIELMKFMNSEAKSYHKSGPHNSPAKPQQATKRKRPEEPTPSTSKVVAVVASRDDDTDSDGSELNGENGEKESSSSADTEKESSSSDESDDD